ncbi:MAG TPA: PepSY-associated TM helix domain-containing protein [Steroidobacteraceae bacterium]|nr:PepSY-associated TM helix domain-containing protein [Steroidobacteraceae bacterium]
MFANFRLSLTWLHTWFGLVLGFVLMVAFFFGSMSVFDREIDRWSLPETRIAAQPMPSFDHILAQRFAQMTEPEAEQRAAAEKRVTQPLPAQLTASNWNAYTTHRDPVLLTYVGFAVPHSTLPDDTIYAEQTIDPRDGHALHRDQLALGSGFFYPMHFSLHLEWHDIGYWIVGLSAMAMLAALVSGVVMHRKIFREFFTFRPERNPLRSTLDLHNLTGVVALPFHFLWALSGALIFVGIYFPVVGAMMQPVVEAHEHEEALHSGLDHDPSGKPGTLASVDAMVAVAKAHWAGKGMPGEVGFLSVNHVGNSNAYVSIYRDSTDRVASAEGLHFAGATGKVLFEDPPDGPVTTVNAFLVGMHLQQFRHWTLRWLIFIGGIVSCICIATGFIFFVEKRKTVHARQGRAGSRWVDALAVTTVTGMIAATLFVLVANRVLPESLADRDLWQKSAFWGAWLVLLLHAMWRSSALREARRSKAWAEQTWIIAALALAAPLLNALTTGDHLGKTLSAGYWPVAGVDLMLLLTAGIAFVTARRLQRSTTTDDLPVAQEPEHA